MDDNLLEKRPKPKRVYFGKQLTIFVVADSKSMDELHPSGLSKKEMAWQAIKDLCDRRCSWIENMKPYYSVVRCEEEFGIVELWPRACEDLSGQDAVFRLFSPPSAPCLADGLEAAHCIMEAFSKQGQMLCSQIVLITDGNDSDKQKTKEIVSKFKEEYGFFIYYLPTLGNETFTGYEYCASLGHTHKWIESLEDDRLEITVPMVYWDLSVDFLSGFFTGYSIMI